jgi:hypothetical protein
MGVYFFYRYITPGTQLRKIGHVFFIIAFDCNEQSAGIFDALGSELFQKFCFIPAFRRAARIRKNISPAAVQKSMIGPGCPGVDIILFDQNTFYTTQGKISTPGFLMLSLVIILQVLSIS